MNQDYTTLQKLSSTNLHFVGKSHDLPTYSAPLPSLADHPLFSKQGSVGIMAAGKPAAHPAVPGEEHGLRQLLKQQGLHHEETMGHYFGPEHSFIIYGPTREQMYHMGKAMGQESVVFSSGGQHELLYTNGAHDGHFHPGLPHYGFHPTEAPPDYWTHLPGRGYLRLHFDESQLHQAPLRQPQPAVVPAGRPEATRQDVAQGIAKALRKALAAAAPRPWVGAYPRHEVHTAHVHRGNVGGVLLRPDDVLRKDVSHPHTAAHGLPAPPKDSLFGGGEAHKDNDQAGKAGTSSSYGKFAAPYGVVDKSSPSVLKFYPLEGHHDAAEAQVKAHGYSHYYAGGKHGKPDLASKNYNTRHLMVYDPEAGSGGDFGETSYTDAWRKTHELAHALTYEGLNQKYGEGRRIGKLGVHRTLREAKRAVEWEWHAAHKQRDLAGQMGVNISDDDFNRELNTVMHDAVHRAVTGRFTDPQTEGFRPHPHKVPLETAMGLLDESAARLGLKDEHDLLKKSRTNKFVSGQYPNLLSDKERTAAMSQASKSDVRLGVAKALRDALVKHEAHLTETAAREGRGAAKLAKNAVAGYGPKAAGVGNQGPALGKCGEIKKGELDELESAPDGSCPACNGPDIEPLGCLGNRDHSLCKGCGMSFSTPRQENAAAGMAKEEKDLAHEAAETARAGKREAAIANSGKNGVSGMDNNNAENTKFLQPSKKPLSKEELSAADKADKKDPAQKRAPGAVLPGDKKSKEIDAEGSGGDIRSGKTLRKDIGTAPTMLDIGRPKLPGMTPRLPTGVSPGTHPEVAASMQALNNIHAQRTAESAPTLRDAKAPVHVSTGGRTTAFVKKPAADDKPVDQGAISGAEKRAAGIGFLSNLIAKFKGTGNQTWSDSTGTGSASQGKAIRRTAARMALAEKSPEAFKKAADDDSGRYVYHATTPEAISRISQEGLVPQAAGRHPDESRSEQGPATYFSVAPHHAAAWGPKLLRFPWPETADLDPDHDTVMHPAHGVIANNWWTSEHVPAEHIEVSHNGQWTPLRSGPTVAKAALAPNDPKRKEGLPSMGGFQSVASNPTAMPQMPGLPKPASFPGAPKAFKKDELKKEGTGVPAAPKPPGAPAAGGGTAPPAPKPATGPAKPKAAPPSAPAMKAEKPTYDDGSAIDDKTHDLFSGKEPKALHPSDKKPKKPAKKS